MHFTKEDHEAVSSAIREAEKKTSGQIVCVLARSSSGYGYIPILWASLLALLTPWPLIYFTPWSVQRIFLLQLVVFLVIGVVASFTPLRLALVPRAIKRARAHREALEQFVVRGITRTKNRTGVLIFVSLAERYARIIADEGIAAKVPNSEWQEAVDALTASYARRPYRRGLYRRGRALRRRARDPRAGGRFAQRIARSALCRVARPAARNAPSLNCHRPAILER